MSDNIINDIAPPRLTVCGSFGFGNTGDEALPLAISDLAEASGINLEIDILSRFSQPALIEVVGLAEKYAEQQDNLKGQPCLVTGGGVIEPNSSCVLSRCQPYLRKSFSSSLALYGANVESGKKYGWLDRFKIARTLNQFDRLYVRDVMSAQVLASLMPSKDIEVIGDSVLWLKPASKAPPILESTDQFICVILAAGVSWTNDLTWQNWFANQLSRLAKQLEVSIVFVPFSQLAERDSQVHRQVANKIKDLAPDTNIICLEEHETNLSPRMIAAALAKSQLTISMRLHGCVMSYAQKVPFVALAYHPKVIGFTKTVSWENFYLPRNVPQDQSINSYGYSLEDMRITESDLVGLSLKALEYQDFSQLKVLKSRLQDTFADFWTLHVSK
ncbi:MAG: polysaccharide pyruvyl transferase family protein [Cyanobacteria bacterium P01_E01_bin.35]